MAWHRSIFVDMTPALAMLTQPSGVVRRSIPLLVCPGAARKFAGGPSEADCCPESRAIEVEAALGKEARAVSFASVVSRAVAA